MHTRCGRAEAWVLVVIGVIVVVGGGVGLVSWSRTMSSKILSEAGAASEEAGARVLKETREAAQAAGHEEPTDESPQPLTDGEGGGKAIEMSRFLRRAVDGADTTQRREEALVLLDRAALEVEGGRVNDSVEAIATLRMALGNGYRAFGRHEEAVRHLRAAVDERRKTLGERHPDTIRAEMALEDAEKAAGK